MLTWVQGVDLVEIVGTETIYQSAKFDFALNKIQTKEAGTIERPFVEHPGSVLMIPVLPDGRLVMVRQFRHPCRRRFLELPAGTAHRGEPHEQTAVRELAEETGYRTARIERIFAIYPLPGLTNELMVYFRCSELSEGNVAREIDEEMDVEIVSLEDALALVASGGISDGKSILGIWWEAAHRKGEESFIPPIHS